MTCSNCVLTGPCLEAVVADGSLSLNIQTDNTTIACTEDGLQSIGGGFTAASPISWSGLTPSCVCSNAVRVVNGNEIFAPELYSFQFSGRNGRNNPTTGPSPANANWQNAIGVTPPNQPGNIASFHPVYGWDADRHSFNFGTMANPIQNPYCRPMFMWFLIRTRVFVNSNAGGAIAHKSSVSLNGGVEDQFLNLLMPLSPSVPLRHDSNIMKSPGSLIGLEVPPGGSFYLTVFNWVDQFVAHFGPLNEWIDSEIQIDALALTHSGNPPALGCPPVVV